MKFATLAFYEFFFTVFVGITATTLTAPSPDSSADHLGIMLRQAEIRLGVICYLIAGMGFLIAFSTWWKLRGKSRLDGLPLFRCLIVLQGPIVVFVAVGLIKPLPDLLIAVSQVVGNGAYLILIAIFAVAALILHYLMVYPFARIAPARATEKKA